MALPLFTKSKEQVKDISVGSGGQDSIYTRPALGISLLYSPTKGCPFFSTTFTDFASIALREKLWRRGEGRGGGEGRQAMWEEVVEADGKGGGSVVVVWVEIVVVERRGYGKILFGSGLGCRGGEARRVVGIQAAIIKKLYRNVLT
ncbi:hypothetical protein Pcinc_033406 [Petrolisthes cinctipes]|uniref:Uncharacterized protein n=1 Tax=Petrolisthes cinctipes TaxID=88211 RepID=A0AAE1ESH0_PETCI|nr:hypothetical protein Pcinc_033406 [Petrolisthes cinctipes]